MENVETVELKARVGILGYLQKKLLKKDFETKSDCILSRQYK